MGSDLLGADEAARLVGVSERTLRAWVTEGRLARHRTAEGRTAYARDDLERLRSERAEARGEEDAPRVRPPQFRTALLVALRDRDAARRLAEERDREIARLEREIERLHRELERAHQERRELRLLLAREQETRALPPAPEAVPEPVPDRGWWQRLWRR